MDRDLSISEPVFRDIFTRRLSPILASHAPRVSTKILSNMLIILAWIEIKEINIIRIRVMASKAKRVIKKWLFLVVKAIIDIISAHKSSNKGSIELRILILSMIYKTIAYILAFNSSDNVSLRLLTSKVNILLLNYYLCV